MQEHRDEKHLKQLQEKDKTIQELQRALQNEHDVEIEMEDNLAKVKAENIRLLKDCSNLQNTMKKQRQSDAQVKSKFEQQTN